MHAGGYQMRLVSVFFVGVSIIWSSAATVAARDVSLENSPVEQRVACLAERDVSKALREFGSANGPRIIKARLLLLLNAKKSQGCRKKIVSHLMNAMAKPNLDFNRDLDSYYLWLYGAPLLGELKACLLYNLTLPTNREV
jgi:hypothetical protein